jgi:hypothetical protein
MTPRRLVYRKQRIEKISNLQFKFPSSLSLLELLRRQKQFLRNVCPYIKIGTTAYSVRLKFLEEFLCAAYVARRRSQ